VNRIEQVRREASSLGIVDRLRQFIVEELAPGVAGAELTSEYPLIDRGIVDSLGILRLMSFVEEAYGVEVSEQDLTYEHFRDLGSVARLVESKRAAVENPTSVA
jgi:acyl carrier protein